MRLTLLRAVVLAAGSAAIGFGTGGCGEGEAAGAAHGLFVAATTVSLGAGARPSALVAGDFNDDGRTDLAVADLGIDALRVLRGRGDGTFEDPVDYDLGAGADPVALVLADFNRDGKPDIAVVDRGTNEVVVFTGTRSGVFNLASRFPLSSGAQAAGIAAADFDGDGRIDVVVSNSALGSVSVARGNGDGTFGPLASFPVAAGFHPGAIAAVDLDRDGLVDVVVASQTDGEVASLRGVGDGTLFSVSIRAVDPGQPLAALAVADLDRDGILDVVVADGGTSRVAVLLGHGDGTFDPPAWFDAGPDPSAIAVADFNRDGNLDLAVGVAGTGSVSVLLGHGDGTFDAGFRFGTAGTGTKSVAVGTLDDDGDPDIAVADETSGGIGVLLHR